MSFRRPLGLIHSDLNDRIKSNFQKGLENLNPIIKVKKLWKVSGNQMVFTLSKILKFTSSIFLKKIPLLSALQIHKIINLNKKEQKNQIIFTKFTPLSHSKIYYALHEIEARIELIKRSL